MRRSLVILVFLVVLCAGMSRLSFESPKKETPFSIAGVTLQMSKDQVAERLGRPDSEEEGYWAFFQEQHDIQVRFDQQGQVVGVQGTRLEFDSVDYTPEDSHSDLAPELFSFLGKEDWKSGERGDFAHDWGYDDYHLVLQFGCGGWYFFLGER